MGCCFSKSPATQVATNGTAIPHPTTTIDVPTSSSQNPLGTAIPPPTTTTTTTTIDVPTSSSQNPLGKAIPPPTTTTTIDVPTSSSPNPLGTAIPPPTTTITIDVPTSSSQNPLGLLPDSPIVEILNKVNAAFVDYFIRAMESFLLSLPINGTEVRSVITLGTNWDSFVEGGENILEFVNQKIQSTESGATQICDTKQALAQILQLAANFHWVVGVLSIVAYLLVQIGQVSDNREECIELLTKMVRLARHIKELIIDMPEESVRLSDALLTIYEGAVMCTTLLKSRKFSRIFWASVDSTALNRIHLKISDIYNDLNLTVARTTLRRIRRNNSFPGSLTRGASTRRTIHFQDH